MFINESKLGELLVARSVLTTDVLESVLAKSQGRLGDALIEQGLITDEQLAQALAEQNHIEYIDLSNFVVPSDLFKWISPSFAQQYTLVPFEVNGDVLTVVIGDVHDLSLEDKLAGVTQCKIKLLLSSSRQIKEALKRSEGVAHTLQNVSEDFKPAIVRESQEGKEQVIALESIDKENAPVIRLVNSILLAALQKRVSDIHIETYEQGVVVKYRIDGVLYDATNMLDISHQAPLISRLKVMAELDIAEKRVPQDGRFKLRINQRDIDFRISVLPSIHGEDVVIRILDKTSITDELNQLKLENLGIGEIDLKLFRKAIHEPYGMVLITGPTGSGKTTTLYSALTELNTGEEKIITIEDPVEYQLDGIVQIPVNEKKELTFARGLRSILRHDPDKIMVGEIRDVETAKIAVQSALTGHLVFTTIHANNAFDVISRFSHMGVDVYSLISALNCVMAQRLIRKICPHCKTVHTPSNDELGTIDIQPSENQIWYYGKGCAHCFNTGYHGRLAITELLMLSDGIKEMILEKKSLSELKTMAIAQGMKTLRQSAIDAATQGVTTLHEVNRVTYQD